MKNFMEKKTELLAPAGNMEALKAAIASGADACYIGMEKFGARAYSDNFDMESVVEAVDWAHLRGVKIYVTMNTIVFEEELAAAYEQLAYLNEIGVDGIIVQDAALLRYIVENFPEMEAHVSTQMGIDDIEGTLLCKEMGAKRVVLAREVPLAEAIRIKKEADIPIEVFVHGALCVSYSGNCLMSGLIGYRSGNRGRCVGSCRKMYELVEAGGRSFGKAYFLSMKDLNTIEKIDEIAQLDSLKIEGRMKEPAYVTNVVGIYREALDAVYGKKGKASRSVDDLRKTFNRTFTKGYMLGEDPRDITNIARPNNFGYEIGVVKGRHRGMYEIALDGGEMLRQNDIIRIDHKGEDVVLSLAKMYDADGLLINGADRQCFIKIKEELSAGDVVYKTKDYEYYKGLDAAATGEYRKFPVSMSVYAYPGAPLVVEAEALGVSAHYESEAVLEAAQKRATGYDEVKKQLGKLGDTIFELGALEFEECGAFLPVSQLNEARRQVVASLEEEKIKAGRRKASGGCEEADGSCLSSVDACKCTGAAGEVQAANSCADSCKNDAIRLNVLAADEGAMDQKANEPQLTAACVTREQAEACKAAGIKTVYFDNIVRRNNIEYKPRAGELLIGGYGGVHYYKDKNPFVTDYSLNVVNSVAVRILHELGASRVTLSYEINARQLAALIEEYKANYGQVPHLEMIVYGRAPLMVTKYCPMKKVGECGKCRSRHYELRDEYGTFPVISSSDCQTTVLNGKVLNLLDEMPEIEGVEAFRLNFTTETAEEVKHIVKAAQAKLAGTCEETLFRPAIDTRGHYNKEIL